MRPSHRTLAIALGLGTAGLLALALWLWPTANRRSRKHALADRETAARAIGAHVAAHFPNVRLLVIGNPYTRLPGQPPAIHSFQTASENGLRLGLGRKPAPLTVVFPKLRPEAKDDPSSVFIDPKTTTPLSFLIADDAFDRLISEHTECDVVVSLIGLPANLHAQRFWSDPQAPRLALLLPDLRFIGSAAAIRHAFESGRIAIAILEKPASRPAATAAATSGGRYLTVTAATVAECQRLYPQLF